MTDLTVTPDRVLELIEIYGAETGAWPDSERDAAVAHLSASPELFAAALEAAGCLDQALLSEALPEPGPALSEAILAQAPKPAPMRNNALGGIFALIFPQGVRWPAGAALASLLMGLVGGYSYASTGVGYDQADAAYYATFGADSGEDWLVSE